VKHVNNNNIKQYLINAIEQSYRREDAGLHSKKSFIHRGTSGEDADNTGCSPSFSSLSTFLLLLSRVAIELRLVTILLDMNEMVHLQMRERGPIDSLRWSRGYSSAKSTISDVDQ